MEFRRYPGVDKEGNMVEVTIATGPVIIEDNKVLLVKHGDDDFWKFPGGTQMDNNNFIENAKREVKEELGLEVNLEDKPYIVAFQRNKGELKEHVILVHYKAKRNNKIKPADDTQHAWFEITNLPSDCGENVKPIVDHFTKNRS